MAALPGRWRTPDGKHRTKGGFKTKKAAEDYATEVKQFGPLSRRHGRPSGPC
ncbi:Arm DNA-binding domain-containing protein [Prescottella agglutinans]|uniref:Arm DNA-binding domain-containing protein n=1 Tax=Prescottella agglutinans TaxID=1644129 RepID=UPI0024734A9B|nr:Arm DNA-binding domain-containing protein [Prescottella agglutinans]